MTQNLRPDELKAAAGMPKIDFSSTTGDREDVTSLVTSFLGVYRTRASLLESLESVRGMDVVQTILDVLIDDGFFASLDGTMFEVVYAEEKESALVAKINDSIKSMVKEVGLNAFFKDLLEDVMVLGEYPFRVVTDDTGVVKVIDDVEPMAVLAFYNGTEPEFFLEKKKNKYVVRSPEEMMHVCVSPRKVRVRIADKEKVKSERTIPEYARIGRSVIYNALQKLKRLQALEMGQTAVSVKKLLAPNIVGVGVPANATVEDVADLIKRYEKNLAPPVGGSTSPDAFTFADIFEMVGRIKVIPSYADGKGTLQKVEFGQGDDSLDEQEKKLRVEIALATGIPIYYLVPGSEAASSKVELLKLYSRYSRRLLALQDGVATSVKQVVELHLRKSGLVVNKENLKVKFRAVVNVDLLDSIEFAVASVETLSSLFTVVEAISASSAVKVEVDSEEFMKMANRFLSTLTTAKGLFKLVEGVKVGSPKGGAEGGDLLDPALDLAPDMGSPRGPGDSVEEEPVRAPVPDLSGMGSEPPTQKESPI